jgi:acyl-coenzyme A thioesterase PaaI-like protein
MQNSSVPSPYVQDFMDGNICFGCGKDNPDGLQIKSYWEGDTCICHWQPQPRYQGWKNLLNGGILATLIDCHTMATATANAYRSENRYYDTEPQYMYATGTMTVKYLLPTPVDAIIELRAQVKEVKGKKTIVYCEAFANGQKTAEAEVIAIRVFDSSQAEAHNPFRHR